MRVYLIRHAKQQSRLCNDNTPLCETGRKQATLLGKRMKAYQIDAVYTSDLLRAKETASIMMEQWDDTLDMVIREGLRESDFGDLTYMTDDDIKIVYKDFMESRYHVEQDWAYPGGESGQEVYERARKVLDEILKKGYQNVAVVTHGGTIRSLLAGIFQETQKNRLMFGKCMERGGFTELFYDEKTGRISLERFNDFAHLEGEPECMMRKKD